MLIYRNQGMDTKQRSDSVLHTIFKSRKRSRHNYFNYYGAWNHINHKELHICFQYALKTEISSKHFLYWKWVCSGADCWKKNTADTKWRLAQQQHKVATSCRSMWLHSLLSLVFFFQLHLHSAFTEYRGLIESLFTQCENNNSNFIIS